MSPPCLPAVLLSVALSPPALAACPQVVEPAKLEEKLDEAARRIPADLRGPITVKGSDVMVQLSEAVAKEFTSRAEDVTVTVVGGGTGTGLAALTGGHAVMAMATRPIRKRELDELTKAKVGIVEVPVAIDALAFVVSRDNEWVDYLTLNELKAIFAAPASAVTWKDVRASWPAEPLDLLVRGRNTGTLAFFLSALDKGVELRGDVTECRSNDELTAAVAESRGGIGFLGCSYAWNSEERIRTVMIDGGEGPVAATQIAIGHGKYWPFAHHLLLYVREDALERPEVRAFAEFYLAHSPEAAAQRGLVPLSRPMQGIALRKLTEREGGTCFLDDEGNPRSRIAGFALQVTARLDPGG